MPKAQPLQSNNRSHRITPYTTSQHTSQMNTSIMSAGQQRSQMPTMAAPPTNERASVAWSNEDDSHLMEYRAKGYNWSQIANHFRGKSANACRKRHERLMEKKNSENYDTVKNEDLANAYMECREEMWRILAAKLGESKWQTIEHKCMEKGLKNLQTFHRGRKHPRQHASSPASHGSNDFEETHLTDDMAQYQHQAASQQYHQPAMNMAYSSYPPTNMYAPAYSMAPPSTAPGNTLPPLNPSFSGHHYQPPAFNMGRSNSHMVSASYA